MVVHRQAPERGLISINGLVQRTGRSRQHIRSLMREKGAPNEVEIEGLQAAQVFYADEAAAWLRSRGLEVRES